MTTAVALSTFYLLVVCTSTSALSGQPAWTTEEETNNSCLDDPKSLPLGVIILDTRTAYDPLNVSKPVTVGSDRHSTNSCVNANIPSQSGSWSRVRRATREKRSDCTKGNYTNTRMCDYNPKRIPAEIDMVDCGQCDTNRESVRLASCRNNNGTRGVWRPKTIEILLPFLTATGIYELRKQRITIACHCKLGETRVHHT